MFLLDRELVAYALIGAMFLVATPLLIVNMRRRKREKLRRRGIKTHGH